jgi:hypothetical protein
MNNNLKIYLLILLGFGFVEAVAQNEIKPASLAIFSDRDYCISGDTVWFKVWQPNQLKNLGNIIHVQLDSKNGNLISDVAVKSEDGWSKGFLSIPDSLSSGQYFITAFLNAQRNISTLETESKSLLVYNRFEEHVAEMELVQSVNQEKSKNNNLTLSINTDKENYKTREKVALQISVNSNFEIKNAIVKATLIDPLAKETEYNYKFGIESSKKEIPDLVENDGLLLNGKVTDKNGVAQTDALVLLSIGGDQPYFDYYYLDKNGDFYFYIKNAIGTGNVVLQVVSNDEKQYFIQLETGCLVFESIKEWEIKTLNHRQVEFVNTAINANFANKLFNLTTTIPAGEFEMQPRFPVSFYGKPTQHVIPGEFIDLPDFREISREILPGVQYRTKNDEVTIRLLNSTYRMFFEDEPLKLINGIPVFKNDFFADLKSTDINYIDIIRSERIFGDLIFKGVLAVSLYDKSNSWMAQQDNIFQFSVNFIQPPKMPSYSFQKNIPENQPDMRQVFLWEILEPGSLGNNEFYLSDRKGIIEISVEGFTTENEFFKTSKSIEVK